ncbi:tail fiber domain-containing protein [Luminiphilus sp.]|nr:tail fiber domain-containing protein [Luminiphilus sp.]
MAYNPKDFGYRDSLPSGDPEKVISGIDFDNEFQAIKRELDALDTELHPDDGSGDLVHEPPNTGKNYVRKGGASQWVEIGSEFIDDTNLVSEEPNKDIGAESRRWNKLWINNIDATGEVNIVGSVNLEGVLTIDGGIEIGSDVVELEDFMQKTAVNIVNEDWQVVLYDADGKTPVINIDSDGVSAPTVNAQEFIGDGAQITGILTDQLDDVQSDGASRDDFLIYNGSGQWVAEPFHIETELHFMGAWDFTAAPPVDPDGGDLYINDTGGAMHSGWGALVGSNVLPGNMVGWSDSKSRWFLLGDVSSSAVVQVVGGDGIVVDDTQPDRPIVGLTENSQDNIALGVEAHGWGNHSTQGYLKAEDVPSTDLSKYYTKTESDAKYELKFTKNNAFNKSFGTAAGTVAEGNHTHSQYLTSFTETDPTVPSHVKSISTANISNWNTAFGWGNHASAGYAKSSDIPSVNYPVTKVNGKTGNVTLNYSDVGAQQAGSYAAANHNHSGVYAPASHTHSYAPVGASYTKAESDAKYELKGAGGGGGLPAGDWHCTGSITAAGNITAYHSSDERLKDDITAMPVGLIDSVNPVTWKWKEGGKSSGGVVAQQLQACGLDDWVNEAPNGDLGVDYNALIGLLLAEVQDLKLRVKELEG